MLNRFCMWNYRYWFSRKRGVTRKCAYYCKPSISECILEDRTLPATITWTGAISADWFTAGNWKVAGQQQGMVPSTSDDVIIAPSANIATVDNAMQTAQAGTLTVAP